MGIFADEQEDLIDFGDGFKIGVRREMTAGIRDDIRKEMARMSAAGHGRNELLGAYHYLSAKLMATRLITPDGELPPSDENLRRLSMEVIDRLAEEASKRTPDLKARKQTGAHTTSSEASQARRRTT